MMKLFLVTVTITVIFTANSQDLRNEPGGAQIFPDGNEGQGNNEGGLDLHIGPKMAVFPTQLSKHQTLTDRRCPTIEDHQMKRRYQGQDRINVNHQFDDMEMALGRSRWCRSRGGRCRRCKFPCADGYQESPMGRPYCTGKKRRCCYPELTTIYPSSTLAPSTQTFTTKLSTIYPTSTMAPSTQTTTTATSTEEPTTTTKTKTTTSTNEPSTSTTTTMISTTSTEILTTGVFNISNCPHIDIIDPACPPTNTLFVGGSCFVFVYCQRNFTQARQFCSDSGWSLATPDEPFQKFNDVIPDDGEFWLDVQPAPATDLNVPLVWYWQDSVKNMVTEAQWKVGRYNITTTADGKNCASIYREKLARTLIYQNNDALAAFNCSDQSAFSCESDSL